MRAFEVNMKSDVQVSVIVLSYNPSLLKVMRTLNSIINQKSVNFELIVSDDGSETDFSKEINDYFSQYDGIDCIFNKNTKNVGTVQNIISAVLTARGKYIYLISPGDMLYDDNVLKDFYQFAEEESAKICFGQYLAYCHNDGEVSISNDALLPKNIGVYGKNHKAYKTSFILGDYIIGPTYFREKNTFIELLKYISNYSIYVEDTTTTAYALAKGISVKYIPRKVVWYELGTGISQDIGYTWNKRVEEDIVNTLLAISKDYPKDRIIKAGIVYRGINNTRDLIKCIIRYPIISFRKLYNNKVCKKLFVKNDIEDKDILFSKL